MGGEKRAGGREGGECMVLRENLPFLVRRRQLRDGRTGRLLRNELSSSPPAEVAVILIGTLGLPLLAAIISVSI